MGNKNILQKSESVLVQKKIFIEKMSFQRNKCEESHIVLTNNHIAKEIQTLGDNLYKCSLSLKLFDDRGEAQAEITVSGIFEILAELDGHSKEILFTKNSMAILFPYLRAQVTLMTAQPDIEPVVLPAININALLEHLEE